MRGTYLPPFEGFTDEESPRVDEILRIMEKHIKPLIHSSSRASALMTAQIIYDEIEQTSEKGDTKDEI